MKKIFIATSIFSLGLGLISCGGAQGDNPGHAYMPDMYYSRAYEAYGYNNPGHERDSLQSRGIYYSGLNVPGTVARGEALPYHLTNDSTGLQASNALKDPLDSLTVNPAMMKEAERLYLVNCGICHGAALDGNGPIYKGGEGAYPVAPRNLKDEYTKALTDGHIYHVITYGIRAMGSYASQLHPEQRWMVIKYIRSQQGGGAAETTSATADSTKTK